jgi:hypothetical protein
VDVNLSKIKLEGQHSANSSEDIYSKRHKAQAELFVEHKLSHQYSLGLDLYYGKDYYNNGDDPQRRYDEEMGGGVSISRQFRFDQDLVKLDYIYSHRQVNVSHGSQNDTNTSFHNILATYTHPWSDDLTADIIVRGSWYPKHKPYLYLQTEKLWSLTNQWRYRLDNNSELSFSLARLSFGGSTTTTLTIDFQYFFNNSQSKRRQRRHKLPNLLIK